MDKLNNSNELLRLTSVHSNNCLGVDLPNLTQNLAYLVSIPAKNIQGKTLLVSVNNDSSKRDDLAIYLPKSNQLVTSYLILPPKERYGLGYTVNLDNMSLDNNKTINELGEISINPFPYNFVSSIKLISGNPANNLLNSPTMTVTHKAPYYYTVNLSGSFDNQYLILSQAYDQGWHAYSLQNENILNKLFPFLGTEIKTHVIINNWENGWVFDDKETGNNLVLVYIPQYFEFLGLFVLCITILAIPMTYLASKVDRKRTPRVDL
jgi:hypothetical protein